ncbi:MAG TPA: N-6 DNA methylase, partial [Ktedonobacteraceae bacterium]|nr:N-6 DNA methylase [Ktedonobacteraceae bacterium]
MAEMDTTKTLLRTMRDGFLEIGYREDLLQDNYGFADMFNEDQPFRSVELGVFAQDPPSYRTACFGVVVPPYGDPEAIMNYRALGAPQIFALHPEREQVICWKMLADGSPILLEKIEAPHLRNAIHSHRNEWKPQSILRAKSIRFTNQPVQLDFFDIGLLPALEHVVYQKLDRLLNNVIASCEAVYKEHHKEELDYEALFRLNFRLIAAKLLGDRQYPGGWLSTNAQEVIKLVENFYFQHTPPESVLDDILVQDTAWRQIRAAFSFRNLSVEALAYVYENTLITSQTRKELGTHATPPEIAEYIVQNMPLEELDGEDRHIFEPFCGHAPFLTAALARLRALLPLDMPTEQRHEYLIRMLSGMETESFACEIARHSLILADYPNPNGWSITKGDFFASDETDKYLAQAQVVLCNPPYEDFSPKDRQLNPSTHSVNKAVEAFHRILQHPPKMLGIVLPRVLINGQRYRQIQKQINSLYNDITLVELPPIFNFSKAETVLLIAHGSRTAKPAWHSVIVEKKDYQQFIYAGRPTLQTEIRDSLQSVDGTPFWHSRL